MADVLPRWFLNHIDNINYNKIILAHPTSYGPDKHL